MQVPLFPVAASSIARQVDYLYAYPQRVTIIMTGLIFAAGFYLRRQVPAETPR